jgi:cytochrome c oxidase subunit II
MIRRWLFLSALAIPVVVLGAAAQERADAQDRADQGRRMFMEQGCHGCHTIGRMGTPIGPDLSYMGAKRSEAYLKNWLRDPASQRPTAHMPRLELTEPQIAALAAFLASLK